MALKVVITCDADGCKTEAPTTEVSWSLFSGPPGEVTDVHGWVDDSFDGPDDWIDLNGAIFCPEHAKEGSCTDR